MVHPSSKHVRIRKAANQANRKVHRLTDMDVEEVSMVDRAANQRKFLVIKRSAPMGVEVQADGKGGFTSRTGAGKGSYGKDKDKKKTTKAMEVPPGFKEMVSPLLTKASELLEQLAGDLDSSKAAEVGEDGEVPGVPADFASGLQHVMTMLDRACSMYPTAPPEGPAEGEGMPAPEDAPAEMQMRLALDNLGKVFGSGKVEKASVLKVGAKMSKDRFTRLSQAAQVLSNLIAELAPAANEGVDAGALGKTKKNDTTEAKPDPRIDDLAKTVGALVQQVGRLAGVVKSNASDLSTIKKSRVAPASAIVDEDGSKNVQKSGDDFSWPMDIAAPINRDTVGKNEGFFDD